MGMINIRNDHVLGILIFWGFFNLAFANTSPTCPSLFHAVSIPEDTTADTTLFTVTCDDVDPGVDGSLKYVIASGNDVRKFNLVLTGTTAIIKSVGTFDFDDKNLKHNFNLEIDVIDGGTPPLKVTVVLDITLTPVNEFDPQFMAIPSSLTLKENTPVGDMVLDTKPYDQDLDIHRNNQKTKVSLTSSSSSDVFYVDEWTGKVFLRHPLDFETHVHHFLELEIVDMDQPPERSNVVPLNITVHNVNEHPPECSAQVYTVKIFETDPPGSTVLHLDCKDIETPHLVYKLYKGDDTKFHVEDHGEITLKVAIDTDKEESFWALEIEVKDHGVPKLDTFVQVNIFVEDVDDNKPYWHPVNNGTYTVSIPENSDIGTFVTMVTAIDDDKLGSEHAKIHYAIEDMTSLFTMESHSGKIIVATPFLDREDKDEFKLQVSAHSSDKVLEKILGEVIVTITDENDNSPVFTQELYSVSWPEDTPKNTILLSVDAEDIDDVNNGKITFSIKDQDVTKIKSNNEDTKDGNTEDGCHLSVDKNSGKISTDSYLDYEKKTSCYLTIIASDGGQQPRVASANAIITISPVNEHAPVFERQSYSISFPEDTSIGTSLVQVESTDGDQGVDGFITYSVISNADMFVIDKDTGIVRLMKELDSEKTPSYLIEIIATDRAIIGQKTGTTTLTLNVDDVNENAPACQTIASVTLQPSAKVGDMIYELKCTDSDTGANADLFYNIEKGNSGSDFSIDSQGHLVVAKLLSKRKYNLEISVFDKGTPSKKTSVFVQVDIEGDPKVMNLPDKVELIESEDIGTVIFTVKTEASSLNEHFTIDSGNSDGTFGINELLGEIYLVSKLDREKVPSYKLKVMAQDTISKLFTKQILTIDITDENDMTPKFSNNLYEFSVMENVPVLSTVGQVKATDDDAGDNAVIDFYIESGNVGATFSVSKTGELILNKALDAEYISDYKLTITATDRGKPPLTGTTDVVVLVSDVDEFPTVFESGDHQSFSISENAPLGSHVFKIKAKDSDKSALMQYQISEGNDGSFIIDKYTGEIILGRFVDRELVSEYNLTIEADNGSGDVISTVLTLTILDENDNDPYCLQNFISVEIDEKESPGSLVTDIQCGDKDEGRNSRLIFTISSGNIANTFRIEGNKLLLNNILDFERVSSFMLGIGIKDGGATSRSTSVTIAVDVRPIYATPELVKTLDTIEIMETSRVGLAVYDIDATLGGAKEGDWSMPGDLEYYLQSVQNSRDFSVNVNSGEVNVAGKLDREAIEQYELKINCVNKYNRNLHVIMTLTVNILDLNDNPPIFSKAVYLFLIDEDTSYNTAVGRIEATDLDLGQNAEVQYSATSGDGTNLFIVNENSGEVLLNSSLNASVKKVYVLDVAVSDKGIPKLSSTAKVIIEVNDINNNAPNFKRSEYLIEVSESTGIGDVVFQAVANDRDTSSNGEVVYDIESGNDAFRFEIDFEKGHISVASMLDREKVDKYTLEVIAHDRGVPPRTSTCTLSIKIIDVNDNKPIFSRAVYDVNIDRFIKAGTFVTKVDAVDPDEGDNAKIDYFVTDGNDENLFFIDINNGEVRTNGLLYSASDSHNLKIKAVDNGYPKQITFATLHIAIWPSVINTGSKFEFMAQEEASVGTNVGTVLADSIHKGEALFNIIGGDGEEEFIIGKTDGVLRTDDYLDRENINEYFLTIQIEDSVNNQTKYHKLVHVIVEDINDNTPDFSLQSQSVNIVENSPIGLPVVHFDVTDDDIKENGNVTLFIDPSDPLAHTLFEIDTRSNYMVLKIVPDYEMISDLSVTVLAVDAGIPSRTSSAEVIVNIIDVKDTKPFDDLPASYFSLECPTNAKNGDTITTFTPHNFGIYQALIDPIRFLTMNNGGVFDIDKSKGDLYVQNQQFLSRDTRYIMWGIAQVKRNGSWNSAAGIIRVDSIVPNEHLVVIEHDVPLSILQSQRNKLKYAIQDLFPIENRVGIWQLIGEDGKVGRRLLATGSKSLMYVVKDRSTDTLGGIEKEKTFLSQDEVLKVLQKSESGIPAQTLQSKSFQTFPVSSVQPYHEYVSPPPSWHETSVGIAVIVSIFLSLLLLAVILFLYFYCTRNGPDKSDESETVSVKFPVEAENQYDITDLEYPTVRRSPAFKPWNASCTSINGLDHDNFITREERWGDMFKKAGFGDQTLRKPIDPPRKLNYQISPWVFKYNRHIEHPIKSLTSYNTKVERFDNN